MNTPTKPPQSPVWWRVKFVDQAQNKTRVHVVRALTAWKAYEKVLQSPRMFPPGFGECRVSRMIEPKGGES